MIRPGYLSVMVLQCHFCRGIIAWYMGMDETWFIGLLAKIIGEAGGDVANELTFVVTALSYPPARYLVVKYFGR